MSGVFGTAPRARRPGEIADDAADVLASIRRLIAQDERHQKQADASPATHLRSVEPAVSVPLRLQPETLVPPADLTRHIAAVTPAPTHLAEGLAHEPASSNASLPTYDTLDWTTLAVTPAPSAAPQIFLVDDAGGTEDERGLSDGHHTSEEVLGEQSKSANAPMSPTVSSPSVGAAARNLFAAQRDSLTLEIRQAIREELQGELGERLTTHLRAMIAEEVARALPR